MGYIYQEYPKWVIHPQTGEQKIVQIREEENEFLKVKEPEPEPEPGPQPEPERETLTATVTDSEPDLFRKAKK